MTRTFAAVLALAVLCPFFPGSEASADERQLQSYLNGRHVLISRREGEAVYGTYFFMHTHYCPSGRYVVYGSSVKQSVLGGEIRQQWEVRGSWTVTTQQGQEGIFYRDTDGGTEFLPMRIRQDGSVFIRDGVSVTSQGRAQC